MGIPAYFSYIIKNFPNILHKFKNNYNANYLFLDSNSIIMILCVVSCSLIIMILNIN